ncbi:MAG: transcriptional regulator [Candidatus Nanoarchaeia archaeon]
MVKLLHPSEIETFYILPALRRQLALFMKASGMQQKDIAKVMHVQSATISQYINNKRGRQFRFNDTMMKEIRSSASVINDDKTLVQEINRLLNEIRESKFLCTVHKKFSCTPEGCTLVGTGCINERL